MITAGAALGKVDQAESSSLLSATAAAAIRRWLTERPFTRYLPRLLEDINEGKWKLLDDAFFAVLEFGTGGRRGVMYPVGTNVLNERTIAESARGLADYLTARKARGQSGSCVVARDYRHNSAAFSELCARVLAAAGFKVFFFTEARSTPLLSFAVRHLGCDAGIMITASHNPPSDNGFKCYGPTGGQVIPPDDQGIIECVRAASDCEIPELPFKQALAEGRIVTVGREVDEGYVAAVVGESVSSARDLSIVYTPLHGVGENSVVAALRTAGFRQINILASQRTPDGDFPNVPGHIANPENPQALDAAIVEARSTGSELVLASDPDADRIGVGIPRTGDARGDWTTLDGNQIGVLLAAFVMKETRALGWLRPDHYLITTLLTSQMARALAERLGIRTEDDLLVGFKWIGQRIDQAGQPGFLFGFEESHGYLKGTYARDKDAAVASLLFAELAAALKDRKQTVMEYLDDLYLEVGHHGEHLINKTFKGREGLETMRALMKAFRSDPPRTIAGLGVTEVHDYMNHEIRSLAGPQSHRPLPQPSGDLVIFHTELQGIRFAARPSGTEPKIKFYLFVRTEVNGPTKLALAKAETARRLDLMTRDIEQYVTRVLAQSG
jgi:phosphoglucomutase